MKIFLRVLLSLISGIVVGSAVNMALIILGSYLVKIPETFNSMNAEDWTVTLFIFPFLAHSLGTFSGAFIVSKLSKKSNIIMPLIVGFYFLAAGIYMVTILPAPTWFVLLDVILSYIPMALLGWKITK